MPSVIQLAQNTTEPGTQVPPVHPDTVQSTPLTACSSLSWKSRGRRQRRRGTVSSSRKGKASEAAVDLTTHSRAMQPSWIQVNRCIRHVFTWGTSIKPHHTAPGCSHLHLRGLGNLAPSLSRPFVHLLPRDPGDPLPITPPPRFLALPWSRRAAQDGALLA